MTDERHANLDLQVPTLRAGFGEFLYTDPLGRKVPVHYYMPGEFIEQIVEEPAEDEVESKVSMEDVIEEAAEDESEVDDDDDDDKPVNPDTAKDEDEDADDDIMEFTKEMFTSQDVIFVMHGVLRNAKEYCNSWVAHAERFNVLVVCPEFSNQEFPETLNYNLGAMKLGVKRETWSFMAIERIFRMLNKAGIRRKGYHLYGHSAGSQFAHRFVLYMPLHCHLVSVVAANAGWYTLPLTTGRYKFPYSLQRSPVPMTDEQLRLAFSRKLTVLLGQEDNGLNFLRRTPAAMAQGPTRFERGLTFFLTAKRVAQELECDFNWSLKTVPRTGHVNRKMAVSAVKEIFAGPPNRANKPI